MLLQFKIRLHPLTAYTAYTACKLSPTPKQVRRSEQPESRSGPNGFDSLSAIESLLVFKTNQTRNRWEHFSMQWGIVRMTSSKC